MRFGGRFTFFHTSPPLTRQAFIIHIVYTTSTIGGGGVRVVLSLAGWRCAWKEGEGGARTARGQRWRQGWRRTRAGGLAGGTRLAEGRWSVVARVNS